MEYYPIYYCDPKAKSKETGTYFNFPFFLQRRPSRYICSTRTQNTQGIPNFALLKYMTQIVLSQAQNRMILLFQS